MNRKFTLYLMLFFFGAALSAQAQMVTIGNTSACAGQEVLIPVTAANLGNIGAITLFIEFDTAQVQYISLENIDPQLSSLTYNYIPNPPQVAIAWSNLVSANFPQTKLFDIRFHLINESSSIVFNSGCEITNGSLQIIPVTYNPGVISSTTPSIQSQPENLTIHKGMNASFSVVTTNTTDYHWKESHDNGVNWSFLEDGSNNTGTHANHLMILNVPITFNGFLYQCILSNGTCSLTSADAALTVDSILFINNAQTETDSFFKNFPNPFSDLTRIEYFLPEEGNVHLGIFNIFGEKIFDIPDSPQKEGLHFINYINPELQNGLYLCKLEFNNDSKRYSTFLKMVKE